MSGHQQQQDQECSTGVSTRKKRRGMIEKRRRDKINSSLGELRKLVPAAFEKQGSAKLEKAEILQMTVDYLRLLHARGLADSLNSSRVPSGFPLHPVQQQTSERVPVSGSQNQLCVSPARLSIQSNQSSSLIESQYNGDNSSAAGSQSETNSFETSSGIVQASSNNQQAATGLLGQNQIAQMGRQLPMSELMSSASPSIGAQSQNGQSPNSLSHNQAAVMAASHPHHLYSQHHQISAAAAYHHHLSNPMATSTDVSSMIPYSQSYHQHHGTQQQADAITLKLDPSHHHHQSSLVGINNHSHPSLLNLDHHHPLSSHYSGHHYQSSALL